MNNDMRTKVVFGDSLLKITMGKYSLEPSNIHAGLLYGIIKKTDKNNNKNSRIFYSISFTPD